MIPHLHEEGTVNTEKKGVAGAERATRASRTLVLSMAVTFLIGISQVIFWFFSNNNLFLIEGAGNLAWIVPDTFMLITLYFGSKTADWRMNYGYRRIETVFMLFFALGIAGFMLYIIYHTVTHPPDPLVIEYGVMTILLSLAIIIILAVLARHIWNVGKEIGSRLLMLDSMVIRMDMASAGILLFSGIFLVIAPDVLIIQTALTLLVALGLFVYSVNEAVQSVKELVDASPSLQVMNTVEQIAEETPEVLFVSEQRIRSFGGAVSVEITIEVDPDLPVRDSFRIASGLEDRIRRQVENVIEVRARVNPAGTYVAHETADWDRGG
jgi:cation diffusion facilitator family transporter